MKINILVTGIGGAGVGRQIIKALKNSTLDYRLFGTDTSEQSFGKIDTDAFRILPLASNENYVHELLSYSIENKIKVIFPGSEKELITLAENIHLFEENEIYVPINTIDLINLCSEKFDCNEFLLENGFHCPKSIEIKKQVDLNKVDFFPIVLKPTSGAGGSANVMIAQDSDELNLFATYLLNNGIELIGQEYIGNSSEEYTIGVLCNPNKEVINSIVMKRQISSGIGFKLAVNNKTDKTELGDRLVISSGMSQGEFIEKSFINDQCENIAKKLGATSAINIQGRIHDDKFYVFEINPRFSGTTSSRSIVGYNEPEVLINSFLLNKSIPKHFKYDFGFVLRGLEERLIEV
jgi:carbamoyl-phosphate synthase large subunit